jgi:predicted RNA-binding protein Jag
MNENFIYKKGYLPPMPTDIQQRYPDTGCPTGYRSADASNLPTTVREIVEKLKKNMDTGTSVTYSEDGEDYIVKVEAHFDNHPNKLKEPYWHGGVSVYQKKKDGDSHEAPSKHHLEQDDKDDKKPSKILELFLTKLTEEMEHLISSIS